MLLIHKIQEESYKIYELSEKLQQLETFKIVYDVASIAYGCFAIYQFTAASRRIKTGHVKPLTRKQQIHQMITHLGRVSLILRVFNSHLAHLAWRWIARQIFTPAQLNRLFSSTGCCPAIKVTYYISLSVFILGAPSTIRTGYRCYRWVVSNRKAKIAKVYELFLTIKTSVKNVTISFTDKIHQLIVVR